MLTLHDTAVGVELMTEQEWMECVKAYQPLIFVRENASVRKLRLVASAYARWLQSLPMCAEARPCADIIEEVADSPKSWDELEMRLYDLPGESWRFSHTLGPDERVGPELSKMVFFAECDFNGISEPPQIPHTMMIMLLREVFGNPFVTPSISPVWLAWNDRAVTRLARSIYEEKAFHHLGILADALEDAGCDNADILSHLRSPGPHVRGCWALDLLLGKK